MSKTKLEDMIKSTEEDVRESMPPLYSPQWSDYVLSQLIPEEMDAEGNPTTDGLRRLVNLLIGPIVRSRTESNSSTFGANGGYLAASILVHLEIYDSRLAELEIDPPVRYMSGAADAGIHNIDNEQFQKFPTAIAETRAEGRALKKVLGLRRVTSDELSQSAPPAQPSQTEELVTSTQVNHFDVICSRLNLNPMVVINQLNKPEEYANIKDVPRDVMAKFFTVLGEYERSELDESVSEVVKGCKGYKKGWRNV